MSDNVSFGCLLAVIAGDDWGTAKLPERLALALVAPDALLGETAP